MKYARGEYIGDLLCIGSDSKDPLLFAGHLSKEQVIEAIRFNARVDDDEILQVKKITSERILTGYLRRGLFLQFEKENKSGNFPITLARRVGESIYVEGLNERKPVNTNISNKLYFNVESTCGTSSNSNFNIGILYDC